MYRIYTDETVDRAIAKGLEELKVSEADVKIDVEEEGKRISQKRCNQGRSGSMY